MELSELQVEALDLIAKLDAILEDLDISGNDILRVKNQVLAQIALENIELSFDIKI